jgi:chemotaxis protein MotB
MLREVCLLSTEWSAPPKRRSEDDGDSFMVTYVALMILLLTFMILMVTLAQVKEPRFRKAMGSVKGAFSFLPYAGGNSPTDQGSAGFLPEEVLAKAGVEEASQQRTFESVLGEMKEQAGRPDLDGLEVEETGRGLAISISDALMFDRGSAHLKAGVSPVLELVAKVILARPAAVSVVGNTCDLPISSGRFPSNWELSIIRAVNVVHYLEGQGVAPESLFAYGMADQCPLVPNDSEAHRMQNRRVEIYVTYNTAGKEFTSNDQEL